MDERRRYKRVPCNALMICKIADPSRQSGEEFLEINPPRTVDISAGGLQIESDIPVPLGANLIMFISIGSIDRPIEIKARSVWCSEIHTDLFRIGIEFVQFAEENDRKAIEDYVASRS